MPIKHGDQNYDSVLASLRHLEHRQNLQSSILKANQRESHEQKTEYDEQFRSLFKVTDLSKQTIAAQLDRLERRCESIEQELRSKIGHGKGKEGSGELAGDTGDKATSMGFRRYLRSHGGRLSDSPRQNGDAAIGRDTVHASTAREGGQSNPRPRGKQNDLTIDGSPKLKLAWARTERGNRLVRTESNWTRLPSGTPVTRRSKRSSTKDGR